jgi:2-amino-4-hydroxy-6-hydroxymethyldihydropteridine diphosphokinase
VSGDRPQAQNEPDEVDAYIALGSNVGDRQGQLAGAIEMLRETDAIEVIAVSDFIETEPVGPGEQDRYLNAAAHLRTTLAARPLLNVMLDIERRHGRDRTKETRWGPRRLDLDLLLYGEAIFDEPGLTVPHPHMHERSFVLDPLVQIASNVRHPFLNETIQLIRDRLRSGRSHQGIR